MKAIRHDEGIKYIEELIRILNAFPDVRLTVNGYADSRGNEDYNLKLSMARARAVAEYLNQKGDFSQRITVNAFGEKDPVARNTTPEGRDDPEGRMFNRRVELIFSQVPANLIIIRQNDIPAELKTKKIIRRRYCTSRAGLSEVNQVVVFKAFNISVPKL